MRSERWIERAALAALLLSTAAIAAAYASAFMSGGAPRWASWTMAIGTTTCMTAITLLAVVSGAGARAAHRGAPLAAVVGALVVVWLLTTGCFVLALRLGPESAADPQLWLGIPRRAAILIYGIGLLPLLVLPFAYALTFDALTLPPEELQRLRDAARRTNTSGSGEAA